MRSRIYYWKCDNPLSLEAKRGSYFADKYDRAGLDEQVRQACTGAFGQAPAALAPLRGDGNHFAYRVNHAGQDYLFRADDGNGDDDYMLAESRLMALAAAHGVPVPHVVHTDVSRQRCPLRFQVMEFRPEPNLNTYHQRGELDLTAVPRQLGQHLRRLHGIPLPGFGFMNTAVLAAEGRLQGLDSDYPAYFGKCLDQHLAYLGEHQLLPDSTLAEIRGVFAAQAPRLCLAQGVLVHRDLALWNVLGTPAAITAIVDWDDAVSGDPADDLGMLACFYDEAFLAEVLTGYWDRTPSPPDFAARMWLHTLRNMLWKTKIRHSLGYFDKDAGFFLNAPGGGESLAARTQRKLAQALDHCRRIRTP